MVQCRVCMKESPSGKDYSDIFVECERNIFLSAIFLMISNVSPKKDDGITSKVCPECDKRLRDAYDLKLRIEKSAQELVDDMATSDVSITYELSVEEDDLVAEDGVAFLLKTILPSQQNQIAIEQAFPKKQRKESAIPYEERKYKCDICDKRFLRKSNLDDHIRVHTQERPFECEICHKTFIQIGNYRSHVRIHTDEKPYKCSMCSKSYNQPSALTIHIRGTHTLERNYKCNECGKSFTNNSDLRKHQKTHDPSKKMKCPKCDKLFAQKINLKNHLQSIHKTQLPNEELRAIEKGVKIKMDPNSVIIDEDTMTEIVEEFIEQEF